ncbi:FKBP-type peptidyl-prolyl cis-trans isomerase [Streptomyces katsurahamanus]|uniref:Peptidyl-prolyl cis-trans isomerase n=1 Tax=Streptomyces katsurahamanus TaxID=2577098 RepID=A0ABW9NV94_9ACTN|nr:FKBP-type peptidyl-prolyl cis-trans isomerase [Streptomyces katsurahamanus]MQS37227.1 FKBP-type peptidyl-prolyl cis-trans isomerase [Streptomyces katsurahamanus]
MRRFAGLLAVPVLLLSTAACGTEDAKDKGSDSISSQGGLPAITEGAKFGEKPTLAKGEGDPPKKLKVEVISEGKGAVLKKGDQAKVNYLGQEWDEKKPFDNSFDRGQPFDVAIGGQGVIQGWQEALKGQKVGSRLEVSIPPDLGYGAQGQGDIKANATLVFVMDIVKGTSVPVSAKGAEVAQDDGDLPKVGVNTDGKAPSVKIPESAAPKKLVSNYVLEGTGPVLTDKDTAVVKYQAYVWKDGKQFDSTYKSDSTVSWPLGQVTVEGLKNGLIGKKAGSRVLLVMPPDQAFGDKEQNGIPKNSTLVFVVDLLTKG